MSLKPSYSLKFLGATQRNSAKKSQSKIPRYVGNSNGTKSPSSKNASPKKEDEGAIAKKSIENCPKSEEDNIDTDEFEEEERKLLALENQVRKCFK